jgi:hypothetical protein
MIGRGISRVATGSICTSPAFDPGKASNTCYSGSMFAAFVQRDGLHFCKKAIRAQSRTPYCPRFGPLSRPDRGPTLTATAN